MNYLINKRWITMAKNGEEARLKTPKNSDKAGLKS